MFPVLYVSNAKTAPRSFKMPRLLVEMYIFIICNILRAFLTLMLFLITNPYTLEPFGKELLVDRNGGLVGSHVFGNILQG